MIHRWGLAMKEMMMKRIKITATERALYGTSVRSAAQRLLSVMAEANCAHKGCRLGAIEYSPAVQGAMAVLQKRLDARKGKP